MRESIVEPDCTATFQVPQSESILIFLAALLRQDAHDLAVHLTPEPRNLLFRKEYRWFCTVPCPIYPSGS